MFLQMKHLSYNSYTTKIINAHFTNIHPYHLLELKYFLTKSIRARGYLKYTENYQIEYKFVTLTMS